jgi:hypothetical protein
MGRLEGHGGIGEWIGAGFGRESCSWRSPAHVILPIKEASVNAPSILMRFSTFRYPWSMSLALRSFRPEHASVPDPCEAYLFLARWLGRAGCGMASRYTFLEARMENPVGA